MKRYDIFFHTPKDTHIGETRRNCEPFNKRFVRVALHTKLAIPFLPHLFFSIPRHVMRVSPLPLFVPPQKQQQQQQQQQRQQLTGGGWFPSWKSLVIRLQTLQVNADVSLPRRRQSRFTLITPTETKTKVFLPLLKKGITVRLLQIKVSR